VAAIVSTANAFEGKIEATVTQGSETTPLLYTVAANFLRIEVAGTNSPNPIDIVDLKSGALTLVFPHNRSFVRLKSAVAGVADLGQTKINEPRPATAATIPTPPAGIGPQSQGATASNIPPMPMPPSQGYGAPGMPPMMSEKIELKPTGKKEKILGYACEQFEIQARGETMEIWATDKLLPFQPYLRNQTPPFGPRMIEEQWAEPLRAKNLFPLRAILHFDNATERFRFEVKSVKPGKIDNKDLFLPPPDYTEIQPLPF
jgi:hypothetical protein